jgi:hypothetical protein
MPVLVLMIAYRLTSCLRKYTLINRHVISKKGTGNALSKLPTKCAYVLLANRQTHLSLQALSKNENNHKALFRKGKAQAELGFTEKAEKILDDLLKKNPTG